MIKQGNDLCILGDEIMNTIQYKKLFCGTYFTNMLGISLVNTIFILFLSSIKGFSASQVSILVGTVPLVTIPMVIVWGRIIDRDKRLMRWAGLLNIGHAAIIILFFFVDNFYIFLVLHFIRSIFTQPTGSIIEESIVLLAAKTETPYGKIRVFGTVAYGAAGIIAAALLLEIDILGVLAVGVILISISAVLFFKLPREKSEIIHKETNTKLLDMKLFKNREYVKALLVIGLTFGTMNAAGSYGTQIALIELGAPKQLIALIPFIMVTLETVVLLNVHRFNVEEKPYRAMGICGSTLLVRWLLMGLAGSYEMILLTTVIHGISVGFGLPAQNYIITQQVEEDKRSSALLINMTVNGAIVPGVLNIVTGQLVESMSYRIFGISYTVLICIALVFILPQIKREKNKAMH